MSVFDCAIIGAGPAGMTAAIYLKRAKVNCILIERSAPGGQMLKTNTIENYPGFITIEGSTLASNMYEQVINIGIENRYGNVLELTKKESVFIIKTDVEEIEAKTVIIATGRQPKMLGLPNEEKLTGRGISYCATCDGNLYKNKVVGVVGGGNTAIEEAIYLSRMCKKVYIFNRSDMLRADKINEQEMKEKDNIEILYNSVIDTLIPENNKLSKVKTTDDRFYNLDGLFIFIGQVPNQSVYQNKDIELDNGYIKVNQNMETTLPGVYACGDIISKDYYQISTAIGEATIAALNVRKYLTKKV